MMQGDIYKVTGYVALKGDESGAPLESFVEADGFEGAIEIFLAHHKRIQEDAYKPSVYEGVYVLTLELVLDRKVVLYRVLVPPSPLSLN